MGGMHSRVVHEMNDCTFTVGHIPNVLLSPLSDCQTAIVRPLLNCSTRRIWQPTCTFPTDPTQRNPCTTESTCSLSALSCDTEHFFSHVRFMVAITRQSNENNWDGVVGKAVEMPVRLWLERELLRRWCNGHDNLGQTSWNMHLTINNCK